MEKFDFRLWSNVCAIFIALLVLPSRSTAQNTAGDVILSAMTDELKHNMDCLVLEGHERPFYISYGMDDIVTHQVIGVLGSLYYSGNDKYRAKSVRVLAGDYEFNDESLESAGGFTGESHDVELPLDNDYYGIRRAYWSSTDQVYKGAARQFARNKEALAEQKKPLDEVPHRSFAKTTPATLVIDYETFEFMQEVWASYVKEVSNALAGYEEIDNSMVYLTLQQGTRYFVSSDGTVIKTPIQETTLQISIQNSTEEGDIAADEVRYYTKVPSELPGVEEAKQIARELAERIASAPGLGAFKEEYTGPVLVEGEVVPQLLMNALFTGRETLRSHNMVPSLSGLQYDVTPSMEGKINKMVAPPSFTVRALGQLANWEGNYLIGHFAADDEGVIPPDTLTLVEKGVLHNLFQDRTITRRNITSNGHSNQTGVVEVIVDQPAPLSDMKSKLIAIAKEQGYEHAYILRNAPDMMGACVVFRVDTETGEEEALRNASFESPSMRELRNVIHASLERQVQHLPSDIGALSSWITPKALLFDEMTLLPANVPAYKEPEYVSRPK